MCEEALFHFRYNRLKDEFLKCSVKAEKFARRVKQVVLKTYVFGCPEIS